MEKYTVSEPFLQSNWPTEVAESIRAMHDRHIYTEALKGGLERLGYKTADTILTKLGLESIFDNLRSGEESHVDFSPSIVVTDQTNRLYGFMLNTYQISHFSPGAETIRVGYWLIDPQYRRSGLAAVMLERLLAIAKNESVVIEAMLLQYTQKMVDSPRCAPWLKERGFIITHNKGRRIQIAANIS